MIELFKNKNISLKYSILILFLILSFNVFLASSQYKNSNDYVEHVLISEDSQVNFKDYNLAKTNVMAVSGKKSWGSFAGEVTAELAGFIPAGKYQKIYNVVYLVITKGWQAFKHDWVGLAWTVVDAVSALIPGAVPAKIFWSIAKLTPSF